MNSDSPIKTVEFGKFGRNIKLNIGEQTIKFNTMLPNTYCNELG